MAKKVTPEKSMHERLGELKFYGPGDEAGELFQSTCHLCYQMSGGGDWGNKKAEILFKWAKEQSETSLKDCELNGFDLDEFILFGGENSYIENVVLCRERSEAE